MGPLPPDSRAENVGQPAFLLVPQRVYRIELRGFSCRIEPEENPDDSADQKRDQDGCRGNQRGPVFYGGENLRSCDAKSDPYDNADHTQCDRLDEELCEDIASMRAHRHARPNLPGPLGHAYEHDVHDPDTADH